MPKMRNRVSTEVAVEYASPSPRDRSNGGSGAGSTPPSAASRKDFDRPVARVASLNPVSRFCHPETQSNAYYCMVGI